MKQSYLYTGKFYTFKTVYLYQTSLSAFTVLAKPFGRNICIDLFCTTYRYMTQVAALLSWRTVDDKYKLFTHNAKIATSANFTP